MSDTSDIEQAIQRVLDGDTNSYAVIVNAYESKVRAVIAAMSPDPNVIEDLTMEVFVIAFKKLSNYEPGTKLDSWLRTIARNVAQNERRRWYRKNDLKTRYQGEIGKIIDDNIRVIGESMQGDVLEELKKCVEHLEEKQRVLIKEFYFKGLSVKELASGLNISEGSIRVSMYRARHALAECLKNKGAINNIVRKGEKENEA